MAANEDQDDPLHIDCELELFSEEHDDHLVTVNISTLRGGIHKTNIWCADCKRMLRSNEARANATIE